MTDKFWPERPQEVGHITVQQIAYLRRLVQDLRIKRDIEHLLEDGIEGPEPYTALFELPTGSFLTIDNTSGEVLLWSR